MPYVCVRACLYVAQRRSEMKHRRDIMPVVKCVRACVMGVCMCVVCVCVRARARVCVCGESCKRACCS